MTEIYIIEINDIEKSNFNSLINFVSDEQKRRLLRFQKFEDAKRTLMGDILARYAIFKRTGIHNNNLTFGKNNYGKPFLLGFSGVHFNISHSENWVICAVDENSVGIDVEVIKPINIKIAQRFFAKEEYLSLLKQPEELRLKYFYMIWTIKESYIKAVGKGMNIPLNSFKIQIANNKINVDNENDKKKYYINQSFLDDNTVSDGTPAV